jgi:hypothetical protein
MSVDTERRSGFDRRKQTGLNVRLFVGNGNRSTIRRQEDGGQILLVDQYSPVLFVAIVGILFLCVIDALFTLYLLDHGAYEINPLIAYLLSFGTNVFFVSKYALTILATFCLLKFRDVVVWKINLTTHSFLYVGAWLYVAVVGWELFLVYNIV